MIREKIVKVLQEITGVENISLDVPEVAEHGDYATNVAMVLFGKKEEILRTAQDDKNDLGIVSLLLSAGNSKELAENIVEKLQKDEQLNKVLEKIEVAGPGFINFYLLRNIVVKCIIKIHKDTEEYGKCDINKGKKVMVEFAHPNTHKVFHIGHLRNISTGESIARLLEAVGYKVVRANYQGDIGMHIAKALWGVLELGFKDPGDVKKRAEFLGKAYAKGATAYKDDEDAKTKIQEINEKIYSKEDEEINELYTKTRQWSLDYFNLIYERVGTKFDRLFFESECAESGKKYAHEALEKGILVESEGAVIFQGSKYGLHDRVFISGKGTPTYEAKDLGLIQLQLKEYNPDLIIHVLGPEQLGYTQVIFKVQEHLFPETKGKQLHVPYGWVRLKGGKMSSRTGNVLLGEQLIDEAKKNIIKDYGSEEKIAEQIAVAAVKYSFLKAGRTQDISFDIKESISLQGDSGPYLQYTYARAKSVLRRVNIKEGESHSEGEYSTKESILIRLERFFAYAQNDILLDKLNNEELSLMRAFIYFPEVVQSAAENYAPNLICNYLHDLAQRYNTFYNKHGILEGRTKDESISNFRLALTMATGQILKNGLNLLGIEAPEKM